MRSAGTATPRSPRASVPSSWYTEAGYPAEVIKEHIRLELLREEFARRAEEAAAKSPAEQIHLAVITIETPPPSGGDITGFTEGLRKISEVTAALEQGQDFSLVAKQYSSDASAETGGDVGWFVRGMLTDVRAEEELFALPTGTNSRQFSTTRQTTFYRVIEKDPARAVTEEQKTKIKETAFANWLEREKREHGAKRLVPGYEFD